MTSTNRGASAAPAHILVAEDDASMAKVIRFNLEEEGHRTTLVSRGDEAITHIALAAAADGPAAFDLVITDLKMPGADGMAVLRAAREALPDMPVVMITAFGTVEQAIEAMNAGALDYITKPFRRREFKARIDRILERVALGKENRQLRERVQRGRERQLLTASDRMEAVVQVVDKVAPTSASVLVSGESGTGKELIARMLHERSDRPQGPFVPLNCAALPAQLLESELFGHERGAFTGADRTHQGRFEQAHHGTLFLDEIGELPLALQSKLLRVLDDGVVDRLGGKAHRPVDVRIVAATNRDLEAAVQAGVFRADLYHRLGVVPIHLVPLRERPEDVDLLARHFVAQQAPDETITLAPALLAELRRRPWPGNVRELKNLMARMVLLRRANVLDLADLAPPGTGGTAAPQPASADPVGAGPSQFKPGQLVLPDGPFSLPALEREIVEKALARHGGNRSAAARYLGIARHVLLYRLEKYRQNDAEPSM